MFSFTPGPGLSVVPLATDTAFRRFGTSDAFMKSPALRSVGNGRGQNAVLSERPKSCAELPIQQLFHLRRTPEGHGSVIAGSTAT